MRRPGSAAYHLPAGRRLQAPRARSQALSLRTICSIGRGAVWRALELFGVSVAVALCGCLALPHPEPQDVARAQRRFPGLDLKTLEQGQKTYSARCSQCHQLYPPAQHRPEEWPAVVFEMSEEGGIDEHDRALIEQYLVTLSARPQ